jgi:two-component system, NarL family, nitrate/nitrite response regulator NarL
MSASPAIRIAVVDDHPLFAQGLELLLPAMSGGRAQIVGVTADASAAVALVRRCVPDLALVDLHMPPPGGVRAIAAIRRAEPRLRLVAMSGTDRTDLAVEALRAGADGYLPKSSEAEELMPPLLAVLDGWAVLPVDLLAAVLHPVRTARPAPADLDAEERRLLRLIAAGHSTADIAVELRVSERTVKRLTASLLRKLRVSSRTEAAALAGTTGLLQS